MIVFGKIEPDRLEYVLEIYIWLRIEKNSKNILQVNVLNF